MYIGKCENQNFLKPSLILSTNELSVNVITIINIKFIIPILTNHYYGSSILSLNFIKGNNSLHSEITIGSFIDF